jgi:ribosome-binding factor A
MRRPERVADMLREEIAQIVGYELTDPRLSMVTVTDVRMSPNLREARVYVMVSGDETEIKDSMKALEHAAPYVRKQVGFALSLRHTPEIHFVRDTVEEKGARVDELLFALDRERLSSDPELDAPEIRKDEGSV